MADPITSGHIKGVIYQNCNTTQRYFQADNDSAQVNIIVNIANCKDSTCDMVATLYDKDNHLVSTVTINPNQEKSLSGKNINYLEIQCSTCAGTGTCICKGYYCGVVNQ